MFQVSNPHVTPIFKSYVIAARQNNRLVQSERLSWFSTALEIVKYRSWNNDQKNEFDVYRQK